MRGEAAAMFATTRRGPIAACTRSAAEAVMARAFDVIVVGAGINGASTAYHLKALGVERVLLIYSVVITAPTTNSRRPWRSTLGVRRLYCSAADTRRTSGWSARWQAEGIASYRIAWTTHP